jgi:adenine-specific DNA-methyltransferase
MILNEIFGESNFVANIVWQKKYTRSNDAKWISVNHDHILCYTKSTAVLELYLQPRSGEQEAAYSNPDSHPKGPWKATPLHAKSGNMKGFTYTFLNGVKWSPPPGTYPRFSKETLSRMDQKDEIWFGANGKSTPSRKTFLSEVKEGVTPVTVWLYDQVGHNHEANTEIKEILGGGEFGSPKPSRLLRRILELTTKGNQNDIVLDSFAGSGTTAHAVLAQNAADGGNRRFILVECEDYADSLTAERVRLAIKGVPSAKDEALKKGLGGSFSFFELGKPLELESILGGESLPSYKELARYVFYTATGEEFDEKAVNEKKHFIGESRNYQVYLFYEPDLSRLKNLAFTLEMAKALPPLKKDKKRLVFAPTKYLDQELLDQYRIDFAQLPFEIYELTR